MVREKIQKFMQGRYGVDSLGHFLLGFAIVSMIISMFLPRRWGMVISVLYLLGIAALVWSYVRMLSKDYNKRYQENVKYMQYKTRFLGTIQNKRALLKQNKQFHIYACPNCKQKIRIPRGKGKIVVTCPKCKKEFTKKS